MFAADLLLGVVVKSSLLLAIAFAVTSVGKKRSPATLHRVWTLSFLGVLVLPLAWASPLAWHISVPDLPIATPRSNLSTRPGIATPPRDTPDQGYDLKLAMPPQQALANDTAAAVVLADSRASEMPPTARPTDGEMQKITHSRSTVGPYFSVESLKSATLCCWSVGVFFCLLRLVRRRMILRNLLAGSRTISDPGWHIMSRECRRELGIWRNIALLRTEQIETPFVFGSLRAYVALPTVADSWPVERRRLVLLGSCLPGALARFAHDLQPLRAY